MREYTISWRNLAPLSDQKSDLPTLFLVMCPETTNQFFRPHHVDTSADTLCGRPLEFRLFELKISTPITSFLFSFFPIKLSAAVHELSCAQRNKTPTKTIRSVATARTVKMSLGL